MSQGVQRDEVERLVEHYLDELIAGRAAELELLARQLEDPAERARFRASALAQEYLVRVEEGGPAGERNLDAFLARLEGEEEVRLFHEVLRDAELARSNLPGELLPGMRLDGRYEVRRELGRGGMGIVYAAFDRELEREVAVKVLRLAVTGSVAGWEELFRRESKTLARLASKNIVAIHDARRGAEHSYIVMDLVRGRDLLQILERVRTHPGITTPQPGSSAPASSSTPSSSPSFSSPPSSSTPLRAAIGRATGGERADLLREGSHVRCVARILRQIAFTLEHAHAVEVIHRDLKPQNVVLVPGGEPVLLDFGLASWGKEGTEEGFRGTPEYMAPEQIERLRAGNDPRTDVYQLGLMLYEMLALRRAFQRKSSEELWPLFERIQTGEVVPLAEAAPRTPRALIAIAEKAMERDPAHRYQQMSALREDLDRFLVRLPPKHAPLARPQRVAMQVGYALRKPLTAVVAALLLAGALWLRTPPWVPPEFSALKVEGGQVFELEEGQTIELEEMAVLGLDVVTKSPTWLYVFQLFGGEQRESQFLRPVCPLTFAEYSSSEKQSAPRGVRLGKGEHRLACAELADPDPYEGLLVYSYPAEQEVLAKWQHTLSELERSEGLPVSYLEALRHLENLDESLRGDPLGTAAAEARRKVVGDLLASEGEGPGEERAHDWRKYRSLHPVTLRSGAGDGGR